MTIEEGSLYLQSELFFSKVEFTVYYSPTGSCYVKVAKANGKKITIRISDHASFRVHDYYLDVRVKFSYFLECVKDIVKEIKSKYF